jgi:hypothetical protein
LNSQENEENHTLKDLYELRKKTSEKFLDLVSQLEPQKINKVKMTSKTPELLLSKKKSYLKLDPNQESILNQIKTGKSSQSSLNR